MEIAFIYVLDMEYIEDAYRHIASSDQVYNDK